MLEQISTAAGRLFGGRHASLVGAIAAALLLALSVSPAAAQTTTVTVAWDRNTDAATAGYWSTTAPASGSYQWTHDAGNQTTAQLTLTRGSVYYVTVRAYNSAGPSRAAFERSLRSTWSIRPRRRPPRRSPPPLQNRHDGTGHLVDDQCGERDDQRRGRGAERVDDGANLGHHHLYAGRHQRGRRHGDPDRHGDRDAAGSPAPTAQINATLQNATTALVTWSTTNATTATINGTAWP